MRCRAVWWAACLVVVSARAAASDDALQWLHRAAYSAQTLTYSGTFVYQCGSRTESSRISHVVDGASDMEHIEMLDGSPREVVRIGDEVKTWLPETRRLVIERRMTRPRFPAVLPEDVADLTDYYAIRRGAPDRVAGFDTQPILLEPRDEFRFRRQLWIERKTGLLLKSETFNEDGRARESSTFTELHVGVPVDRDVIRARFNRQDNGWRVQEVRSAAAKSDDKQWQFRSILPGFRRVASMTRKVQPNLPEGAQLVFSDGLAGISVFIDPLPPDGPQPPVGEFALGALNVYKRIVGSYLLVLMGDVPASALKRFGDGIETRKP